MEKPIDEVSIAIIGGGLGGLACALALQNAGFSGVTVYERDSSFSDRKQGFGLTLTNNSKGPLAKLGILRECWARDCPSNFHWVFSERGDILGYYGRAFHNRPTADESSGDKSTVLEEPDELMVQRGNLRIPRQDLRQMLMERLAAGTIKWGKKLLHYCEGDGKVDLFFVKQQEEGPNVSTVGSIERIQADVVVGADGMNSLVRQLRDRYHHDLPESRLEFLHVAVIVGISTAQHPLLDQGGFYVLDGQQRLFTMPFRESVHRTNSDTTTDDNNNNNQTTAGNDSNTTNSNDSAVVSDVVVVEPSQTMWQLSFAARDEADCLWLKTASPESLLIEAKRRTQGWFEPVLSLLQCTKMDELWGTPLYDRPPMGMRRKDGGAAGARGKKRGEYRMKTESRESQCKEANSVLEENTDLLHQKSIRCSQGNLSSAVLEPSNKRFRADGIVGVDSDGNKVFLEPELADNWQAKYDSHVTVIGDAAHPMSMFKGQGCNQAMEDGPLLADWLLGRKSHRPKGSTKENRHVKEKGNRVRDTATEQYYYPDPENKAPVRMIDLSQLTTRLRCFEREMIGRTTPKVQASRAAAQQLHSHAALSELDYGVDGLASHGEDLRRLRETLREKNINARYYESKQEEDLEAAVMKAWRYAQPSEWNNTGD